MAVVSADGSVDISIDVGGRLNVRSLPEAAVEQIQALLETIRRAWTEELLLRWPVLTGLSQSKWRNRIDGLVWTLTNPVEYAEYVHRAGESDPVYLEMADLAEEMLASVMPKIVSIVSDSTRLKVDKGRRRLLSSTKGKGHVTRAATARLFREEARRFQEIPGIERHRRRLRRMRR